MCILLLHDDMDCNVCQQISSLSETMRALNRSEPQVRNSMADCLTANGMPEEALKLLCVSASALGREEAERGANEDKMGEVPLVLDTVLLNSGASTTHTPIPTLVRRLCHHIARQLPAVAMPPLIPLLHFQCTLTSQHAAFFRSHEAAEESRGCARKPVSP